MIVSGRLEGIWWRAEGLGPPLLLIQGLGYSSDMWYRLVPELAMHARVLIFDNRGIGRSMGPVHGLTIEQMGADAAAVIRAAGEESAHVFGVSLGGIVAQELALSDPRIVRHLVLGCTHTADEHVVLAGQDVLEMLVSRSELPVEAAARASVPFVYAPTTSQRAIEDDLRVRLEHPPSRSAYEAQLMAAFDYRGTFDRLPEISAPTLVVHGSEDLLVPPANATVLAARIPGARLEFLPAAGHLFFTEAPSRTTELVLDHIGDQGPSRGG